MNSLYIKYISEENENLDSKGQLTSKQNCRAVTSPKKRTKRTQPSNPAYYIEDCRISKNHVIRLESSGPQQSH